jgi:formamidopyrimidine-DNA glycosylase
VPEGDTVWLAGHNLRRALAGHELVRTDFRVPRYATTDLSGRRVLDIVSRGKHLLWRLGGDVTLHTHFKMDGSWHLYRRGQRWRSPAFEARAVLETESWQAVGFRMPILELIETERENEVVGHLGPDLLGDDWDPEEATARLRARTQMVIGEALLDQTVMAGVGNVYRCELCFLRGLNPWTPVPDVPDHRGVVDLAKRLLEANRHSARHVTTGVDRPGRSHYVYGRRGRPCLRCGTPIRMEDQPSYGGKRILYWCPACQSSPSASQKRKGRLS